MKTRKIGFYALGSALLLTAASCSNDMPGNEDETYNGPLTTNYLTVNLVASNGQSTRAAGDTYQDGNATYQDGTTTENAVQMVRFYFFDSAGEAADVKSNSGSMKNYYDWTPNDNLSTYPDDDNIEKILTAEIVISTADDDEIPASIVAVVNPSTAVQNATVTSLNKEGDATSLNALVGNYSVTATGPFMMSNSVYLDNGVIQEAVPVTDHLHSTSGAALADPVTIYVERVNAKAQTTVALDKTTVTYNNETFDIYNVDVTTNPITVEGINSSDVLTEEDVYVRFLGWNVTCATNQSYLMKEIATNWTNTGLFGTTDIDWNSPTRFRSFWAINPTMKYDRGAADSNYTYGNFYNAYAITSFDAGTSTQPKVNYTYLQENAALNATTEGAGCAHPTQLIVAGQLVNAQGAPLPLAEYGFNQYTPNGLLTVMAARSNIYTRSEADGKVTFTPISASNLEFVTATEAGLGNANTDGRYYAYVNLKEDAEGPFYIGTDEDADPASEEQLNDQLEGLGHAKIWNNGYTYYYIDIRHLGNFTEAQGDTPAVSYPGTWGIVRNHIYAMNITSLVGLGTPVLNLNEVIYPEHPQDEDTYIAAQINILNWRLVNQNVGFAW